MTLSVHFADAPKRDAKAHLDETLPLTPRWLGEATFGGPDETHLPADPERDHLARVLMEIVCPCCGNPDRLGSTRIHRETICARCAGMLREAVARSIEREVKVADSRQIRGES